MAESLDYRLRPATSDDREFLYQLHRDALGAHIERIWGPWDDAVQRAFHDGWFQPERVAVIEVDGRPVGVLDVRHDEGAMDVARIELTPEAQGRGIGTALMTGVIAQAEALGVAVELEVIDGNRAQALYERLGFVEVGRAGPKVRMRRASGMHIECG